MELRLHNNSFVELMTQPTRFAKFVRCLGNVERVIDEMTKQSVLNTEDKELIVGNQMRQHQKDALINTLAHKNFYLIDKMIYALDVAQSSSASVLMKAVKYLVMKQYNIDAKLLDEPASDIESYDLDEVNLWPRSRDQYPSDPDVSETGYDWDKAPAPRTRSPQPQPSPLPPSLCADIALLEIQDIKLKLEEIDTLESLADEDARTSQTSLHACLKRSTDVLECLKLLLSKFEQLQNHADCKPTSDGFKTVQSFINHQNDRKQTVAHLAAERSLIAVLLLLHKRRCNFFIEDDQGLSSIRMMYMHAPEAVSVILNDAITPTGGWDLGDSNVKVEFDFCTVIGKSTVNFDDQKSDCSVEETELLAELVHWNRAGAKLLLSHLAIKLFLEFKWAKMKFWFTVSIFAQIFVQLIFTLFVIQVFLVDCRHATASTKSNSYQNITKTGITENELPKHFYNYLFGTWAPVKQVLDSETGARTCKLGSFQLVSAVFLFIGGCLLSLMKEMSRLYIKGFVKYFSAAETFLQLASIFCITWVTSLAFKQTLTDSHYTWAATGVIISWTLILMRLGNFYGMGLYVQMLGKVDFSPQFEKLVAISLIMVSVCLYVPQVFKRFLTLMCVYVIVIIAFSIAFSIMLPQEEPFKTLPRAISRIAIMMTGEFDYKDTFYGANSDGPPIPLPSHVIFGCFAILLTVILMNWLIGMTVNDINALREKSEIVLMSIKIDHISFMERSFIRLQKIIPRPVLQYFSNGRNPYAHAVYIYLDIYVLPLNQGLNILGANNSMVIEKRIKDIPKWLQKPLIHFAITGNSDASTLD